MRKIGSRTYQLNIYLRDDRPSSGGKIAIRWNEKTVKKVNIYWHTEEVLLPYEEMDGCYIKTTTLVFVYTCRFTVPSTQNCGLLGLTAYLNEEYYDWHAWTDNTFIHELFHSYIYFKTITTALNYGYYIELSTTNTNLV